MDLKTRIQLIRLAHIVQCEREAYKYARKALKARGWKRYSAERTMDACLANLTRDPLGVQWRPRLGIFKEHRVTFDYETGYGTSYEWYAIAKRIDGTQVLNTYNYSQQTSMHVSMLKTLFVQLGIKYVCIEAPRGLQDLDSARKHVLYSIALQEVSAKYSRDGKTRYVGAKHSTNITELRNQLKTLARFNYASTPSMKRDAMELAESERRWKLERLARRRAERKAVAALIIEVDVENKRAAEAALHYIAHSAWSWDGNKFVGNIPEYERRRAVSQGFSKIIVHKTEPRHLTVVSNQGA